MYLCSKNLLYCPYDVGASGQGTLYVHPMCSSITRLTLALSNSSVWSSRNPCLYSLGVLSARNAMVNGQEPGTRSPKSRRIPEAPSRSEPVRIHVSRSINDSMRNYGILRDYGGKGILPQSRTFDLNRGRFADDPRKRFGTRFSSIPASIHDLSAGTGWRTVSAPGRSKSQSISFQSGPEILQGTVHRIVLQSLTLTTPDD